jgi:hypothetical protein
VVNKKYGDIISRRMTGFKRLNADQDIFVMIYPMPGRVMM